MARSQRSLTSHFPTAKLRVTPVHGMGRRPQDGGALWGGRHMDTEVKAPALLLGIGVIIQVIAGFVGGGGTGAAAVLLAVVIIIALRLALALPACYLTAKIMNTGFGYLSTAILKLAAIAVFPSAVSMLIPIPVINWLIAVAIYFGLIMWLFQVEFFEAFILTVVIWLMNVLAMFVFVGVFTSRVGG